MLSVARAAAALCGLCLPLAIASPLVRGAEAAGAPVAPAEPSAGEPAAAAGAPAAQAVSPPPAPAAASDPAAARDLADIEAALQREAAAAVPRPAMPPSQAASGDGLTAGNLMNPALALIADFAIAYFSERETAQRGGHDPRETGFNLQSLELSVQAAVDPYFRLDANIVFQLYGVEIEEAYATTLSLPLNLQVRTGQFLQRFGRVNETHPHSWQFVDQPLAIGKFFGGDGQRGLGLEVSALLPLPWYVEIVTSAMKDAGDANARSFYGASAQPVDGLEDFLYFVAIKQFFPLTSNWSLSWGLSALFGPNATGRDNRTEIYGTDLYLKWRPITQGSYSVVSFESEWLLRRRQVPGDVLQDVAGHAQLFWRFARRWATAARYEFASGAGNDDLDPGQDSAEHRVAGNVTFWPTEYSRLRLQYGVDVAGFRPDPVHSVVFALEWVAGAHGAHRF